MRAAFALLLCLATTGPIAAQEAGVPPPFPSLRAENLLGEKFAIPDDLPGEIRLIFVAFKQRQQPRVDTWLAVADAIQRDFPGLRYFEFPTIARPYRLMKPIIDNGMRSGITADAARARTITVFTNVGGFVEATGLPGTSDIAVFVLDGAGRIRYTAVGPRTDEGEEALRAAIATLGSDTGPGELAEPGDPDGSTGRDGR